jgi:hypothetical protein
MLVLVALDKADKLKGPLPLILLAIAAAMTLPLTLGNAWVAEATPGMLRIVRSMMMVSIVVLVYALLVNWILPKGGSDSVGQVTTKIPEYVLSLSDLRIIQDDGNPMIDLSIGLVIKSSFNDPIKYQIETAEVLFNGQKNVSQDLTAMGGGIIRKESSTMFTYRSVSNINKKIKQIVNVEMRFSIIYGVLDSSRQRRWSYGLKFTMDPIKLGEGRYTTMFDKDEALPTSTP